MLALAAILIQAVTAPATTVTDPVMVTRGDHHPLSPTSPGHPTAPPSKTSHSTLFDFFASSAPFIHHPLEWGDSIHSDPDALHRVYFQNIDGLRNSADDMDLYVSSMAQFKTSTFCWADHGLDLAQTPIRQALARPISAHFGMSRSSSSYSHIPSIPPMARHSGFQPGGTFTATTGKWATRSSGTLIMDPTGMGRWSGICFLGKCGKRLAVLTAYRSPRQQPSGGNGFFDQQYAIMLSQGVQKPNVRKAFIADMIVAINKLQTDGFEIILSLDANETVDQSTHDGISHLIESCTLHDLHCSMPSAPPATYKYGNQRRIDFMLGSANVLASVRRAGYLAYDNVIFSKHHGLYIDFDYTALMGSVDNILPPVARGISSEDQPSVDRYIQAFKEYAAEHHLWLRVKELGINAPSMNSVSIKEHFDSIDRDVTRAMLHAEKQAKRPSGKYAWSPKLREAGLLTRFWHLRLREVESGKCLRFAIEKLKKRITSLNIACDLDSCLDAPALKARHKEATKLLRTVRNDAYDHRAVHLKATLALYTNMLIDKDNESARLENKSKIARITRLINIESMRRPFRTIHASVTPLHSGGLSKLFVPIGIKKRHIAAKFCSHDGSINRLRIIQMAQTDKHSVEYATILDCAELENELLRYNHEWLRQASDAPFDQGELYEMVEFDGLTAEADAIIHGECVEHMGIPMSREIQTFLEECRRPDSVNTVDTVITRKDFTATVKAWKEKTSTSPSGRHLGHYRTVILDEELTGLHTDLINLPIAYGFAPERWTHSVTPMIEKDAGLTYLTRLRVIHLFEADYNLFLKLVFGKRMLKNAEMSQALNDQQHGSRPRRMTTDALFLARLEKDIIRQVKANSAHMDNDATGCYDRIVPALGMLACRRLGIPDNAIACQAQTLFHMRYAVKHQSGISTDEYGGDTAAPLFGTGQGSGFSSAGWLALCIILLNCLDRLSEKDEIPGLLFRDPWGEFMEAWRASAFVDDTNPGVMDSIDALTIHELVEELRRAGQLWETLLHISGGCLNLSKCSWNVQFWHWPKGRPVLMPIHPSDPPLLMTSGSNPEHHIIKRHSNMTEVKSLGVHMNFLGTYSVHAKQMRVKFDGLA